MRTQIVYVFASNEAIMRETLDSFRGTTLVSFSEAECVHPRKHHAKRVAYDCDAVVSQLGWDHAGISRTVFPGSEPLQGGEYDPECQRTASDAHKHFVGRVEKHLQVEGMYCWRVAFAALPAVSEPAQAWLEGRLNAHEAVA